jgi:hypothetical protein
MACLSLGLRSSFAGVPAQAEVSASKGPIRLTLRVLRTSVQLVDHTAPLWLQIKLENVGRKPIFVSDEVFFKAQPVPANSNPQVLPIGTFLEVKDSHGRLLPLARKIHYPSSCAPSTIDDAETGVNGKGLSGRAFWLQPGQSTATAAWASFDPCEVYREGKPVPSPIGEFSEFNSLIFLGPGAYSLRAQYNHEIDQDVIADLKKVHAELPVRPENIRVATPVIRFDVLPRSDENRRREMKELEALISGAKRRGDEALAQILLKYLAQIKNEK